MPNRPVKLEHVDERLTTRREVRKLIRRGRSDDDIKSELCLPDGDYADYRDDIFRDEAARAKRPTIEVFVEYQLLQLQHVDELEDARKKAMDQRRPQHAVTAIKAKAELLDKIIQRGQDLGVYHREGQKLTVNGAMGLVHMSQSQLAAQLDRSVMRLKALSDDLGQPLELMSPQEAVRGGDILEKTEDVAPAAQPSEQPASSPLDLDEAEEEVEVFDPSAPVATGNPRLNQRHYAHNTGDGDPGPEFPMAERIYKAAMEPKPIGSEFSSDEVRGDHAGIRGRVFATCPVCCKRLCGIPGMSRHIRYLHNKEDGEATEMAQKAIEAERMSIAREFASKMSETDQ